MKAQKKREVIVVIPFYHMDLSEEEIISLEQVQKVLAKYNFCFVAPLQLKPFFAREGYRVEFFESVFFESVSNYNRLMLTAEFYERFTKYRYMLIYQLDAFVFYDRLDYFCDLDYDYIGSPWIYPEKAVIGELMQKAYVGNGGLSLRNVKKCINLLNDRKKELEKFNYNEDFFFSAARDDFKVAPLSTALEFSFETHVRKCFEINGGKLPFGCHAWERYDFLFWKPYMEKQGYDLSKLKMETGSEDAVLDKKLEAYKYKLFETMNLLPIILQKIFEKKGLYQKHFSIWGAGRYGQKLMEIFSQLGIRVDYIVDEDLGLQGQRIRQIPILSFEIYKTLKLDNLIIISVKKYTDDIQLMLEKDGYQQERDFLTILDLVDMYYLEILQRLC